MTNGAYVVHYYWLGAGKTGIQTNRMRFETEEQAALFGVQRVAEIAKGTLPSLLSITVHHGEELIANWDRWTGRWHPDLSWANGFIISKSSDGLRPALVCTICGGTIAAWTFRPDFSNYANIGVRESLIPWMQDHRRQCTETAPGTPQTAETP